MSAAEMFYYSATIGIWIVIFATIFIALRINQLLTAVKRTNILVSLLSLLSHLIYPKR